MSDREMEPTSFDSDMKKLEYEKMRAELEKTRTELKQSKLAWWKRPAYIAALVPVLLSLFGLLTAWSTGFFSNERVELKKSIDKLASKRDELADETSELAQQNEQLNAQLASRKSYLDAVQSVAQVGGGLMTWADKGKVAYAVSFEPDVAKLLDFENAAMGTFYYDIPSSGNTNLDTTLQKLEHINNLQYLFIDGDAYSVTDKGLRSIENLTTLRGLVLQGEHFDDESMRVLSRLKNLESLHLDTEYVSDKGLRQLSRLANLKSFAISSDQITNGGVLDVAAMQELESLMIMTRHLDEAGLRGGVAALSNLEELSLGGVFDNADLEEVGKLLTLRRLAIDMVDVKDLNALSKLESLEKLMLNCARMEIEDLAALTRCARLETLKLENALLRDVSPIANLKALRVLDLAQCGFRQGQAKQLIDTAPANLDYLSLANTPVNDADLANVRRFKKLKVLEIDYSRISDIALLKIRQLPSLQQLSVDGTFVTQEGLRGFSQARPDVIIAGAGVTQEQQEAVPEAPRHKLNSTWAGKEPGRGRPG